MKTIYIILLIFILLYIFIYLLSKPFKNPYLCIGYIGKKGSGKTTKLTQLAINEIKKGHIVYSTEYIKGTNYIDFKDIGNYDFKENSILLIDEIGLLFPARDYKNFKPQVREFFKLQRHKKIKVYWFTQTWIDCDKTIRDLTDKLYLCHNFFNMWSTYRQVSKVLTIGTTQNQDGSIGSTGSDFVEQFKYVSLLIPGSLQITFIPHWVVFFDSYKHEPKPAIKYKHIHLEKNLIPYFDNKYAYKQFLYETYKRFVKWAKNRFRKQIKATQDIKYEYGQYIKENRKLNYKNWLVAYCSTPLYATNNYKYYAKLTKEYKLVKCK